jgi:hypothetical protein
VTRPQLNRGKAPKQELWTSQVQGKLGIQLPRGWFCNSIVTVNKHQIPYLDIRLEKTCKPTLSKRRSSLKPFRSENMKLAQLNAKSLIRTSYISNRTEVARMYSAGKSCSNTVLEDISMSLNFFRILWLLRHISQ